MPFDSASGEDAMEKEMPGAHQKAPSLRKGFLGMLGLNGNTQVRC